MYQQIWKDIPTWVGIYQVSNFGRVKRIFKNGKVTITNGWKVKRSGHYKVKLSYKRRQKTWEVSRLVATVFQRPLIGDEEAHHKNKMLCCNCAFNIQIKNKFQHLSDHNRGKKYSQQSRMKMSESRKGNKNKLGKKCSQQTKRKMSEIKKLNHTKKDPITGRFISVHD